jgi:hypothetical protein
MLSSWNYNFALDAQNLVMKNLKTSAKNKTKFVQMVEVVKGIRAL